MAGLHKNKTNSGDCLVLNTDGRIAEAISSNIFLMEDGVFYTPSLQEACVAGVMRDVLIHHLREQGKQVVEKGITVDDLLKADEIFLSDVIHGLRWVGAFKTKRYFNNFSLKLIKELNDIHQIKKV